MIDSILGHLTTLVSYDTQNPPRAIEADHPLFSYLDRVAQKVGWQVQRTDHDLGRLTWLAVRGQPRVLFHVHLDTVPAATEWSGSPLKLRVENGHAIGLGTCDIKGAAACLLAIAESSRDDMAVLFTTDEEGAQSCCVDRFCRDYQGPPFELVVVAEPTESYAVLGHRGYLSITGQFSGQAAHTSTPKPGRNSATHKLIGWGTAALALVDEFESQAHPAIDLCFNVGQVSGGTKNNVVAESAELKWSARPPAGFDAVSLRDRLTAIGRGIVWSTSFLGASFPKSPELRQKALDYAQRWQVPQSADVNFWTEAAIFSQYDKPALVLGPGCIRQAHSVDEFVSVQQLEQTATLYQQIISAAQRE